MGNREIGRAAGAVTVFFALVAVAAPPTNPPANQPPATPVQPRLQLVGEASARVYRYLGTEKGQAWGHQVLFLWVEPGGGGARQGILIPNMPVMGPYNPDPRVMDILATLKPGDFLRISTQNFMDRDTLLFIGPYAAKPGEDTPNGYLFVETHDQKVGQETFMGVALNRFGQQATVLVPNKRGTDGKMAPDPDMAAHVQALAAGDVVETEIKAGGILASIEKYIIPEKGEFVQALDVDVDGAKRPAAEVKVAGEVRTLLIPLTNTAKPATDLKLLGLVRRMKAGQTVVFQARVDGDKLVLKDIQPEPKPR